MFLLRGVTVNRIGEVMATKEQNQATTRREFMKKAVYVAPAVLSLKAAPSFAKTGSVKPPKLPKPPKKP